MTAQTEKDLHAAIAKHFASEGLGIAEFYAIEVRVIADAADGTCPSHDPAGGRKVYRTAGSYTSLLGLSAFGSVPGTSDVPVVRTHEGITS